MSRVETRSFNDSHTFRVSKSVEFFLKFEVPESQIAALEADHEFLLKGGVFTKEMLDAYIELKTEDVRRLNTTTHPVEFDMYYSL